MNTLAYCVPLRVLAPVAVEDILEEVLGELYDEDDDRSIQRLLAAR
jgi:Mg2+/Co2+ transporter CorB